MEKIKWPNGHSSAFTISFDVDGSCRDEFMLKNTTGVVSAGDYGPKVGVPRVLDMLDKLNCKATFHVPGRTAERYPARIKEIVDRGNEVAAHGFWHQDLSKLSEKDEWEEQTKAHKVLIEVTGTPPKGFRTPGGPLTPRSLEIISKLGYIYDSSSFMDYFPSRVKINGKEIDMAELPMSWIGDDMPFFWGGVLRGAFVPLSGFDDALKYWKAEFNGIHKIGGMMIFANHPRCCGRPSRLRVLEKFIRHVKATPGVWFSTQLEVAEFVLGK